MTRSRLAWLLSLGLLIAGWAAAHVLAYRIAVRDAGERRHLLETTGHGYLETAPLASLCLTLVALGLAACLLPGRVPRPSHAPWLFAALPPVGFVVQEHLERLLHDGQIPFTAALEPTFAIGLLLQLPFALAALLLARALLVLTDALVRRLRRESVAPRLGIPTERRRVGATPLPRAGVLALGYGQRAPPLSVLR